MLPRDIGALAVWLRDLRKQFPDRPIVAFADNFHHYDCRQGGPSEGEGKVQYLARYAKDLAIRHHATLIMTMELPMWALKPGVRPRISTLKGSTAMAYEASANIGVYNDLKDFGQKSMLVWEDKNELEEYELPDGTKQKRPVKKPVIELVFDKSKIFKGFDGTIYYHLDPGSGRYQECPPWAQARYERLARAGADRLCAAPHSDDDLAGFLFGPRAWRPF